VFKTSAAAARSNAATIILLPQTCTTATRNLALPPMQQAASTTSNAMLRTSLHGPPATTKCQRNSNLGQQTRPPGLSVCNFGLPHQWRMQQTVLTVVVWRCTENCFPIAHFSISKSRYNDIKCLCSSWWQHCAQPQCSCHCV